MSSKKDRAEIEALLQQLAKAHADHDADAIVESYTPDAVIYDLSPPLTRHGMSRKSVTAWLGGWEGPIQIASRDDMWYRTTMCLQKASGRWRIACDHSSVPFYMDGSYRAAVDLKP
jgi:ketosteroid isomerase-like protein